MSSVRYYSFLMTLVVCGCGLFACFFGNMAHENQERRLAKKEGYVINKERKNVRSEVWLMT